MFVKNPEPLIAEKPIRVWKILIKFSKGIYCTPHQFVEVKVGDTLYARNPDKSVVKYYETSFGKISVSIIDSQGVHAFQDKEYAKSVTFFFENEVVTEWEIPKGCKYWLETGIEPFSHEIAATEMKFIKEL